MNSNLILEIKYGGLGDHLFFSMIPRMYKTKYKDSKVYISKKSNFRNDSIRKLIWDNNPYIDGFTDERGIVFELGDKDINIIIQIIKYYIGEDKYEEPEIYFKNIRNNQLGYYNLVDLNYKSFVGAFSKKKVINYLLDIENIVLVNPPNWIVRKITSKNIISNIDLETYLSLISYSKNFICFTSGSATLAASIRKSSIAFYGFGQSKCFRHTNLHKYKFVGYDNYFVNVMLYVIFKLKNRIKIYFKK